MGLGSGGSEVSAPRRRIALPPAVWFIALGCLALQFWAAPNYGYFRDELYYLACSQRLAWGYVDQPPFSIAVLWAWTKLFGESLLSLRTPMALCYAGTVVCNAVIAADLDRANSRSFAPVLAAMATAVAPVYMVVGHLYAMNGIDVLMTSLLVLSWIRAKEEPKWWWIWGMILGVALLNKWSVGWVLAGMLLPMQTPRNAELGRLHFWAGIAIAFMIALPSLLWQADHGWPMVEFLNRARATKMLTVPPWQFVATQLVVMNVVAAPIWLAGMFSPLSKKDIGVMGSMVIAFVFVVGLLVVSLKSRANYLSPAFALVIPVGAVLGAEWLDERRTAANLYIAVLGLSGLAQALVALPVLPLPVLKSYLKQLPTPPSDERGPKSTLQGHSDTVGWPELADATRAALSRIPEPERSETVVLASNYGEAAALEFYGLPNVICPHNSFWLWGTQNWNGRRALLVGRNPDYAAQFGSVREVGRADMTDAVPEEAGMEIREARDLKVSVNEFWRSAKRFE